MTENLEGSPVFAGRYRFELVSNDWDRGRSGLTHLVYDMKLKRFGVIKRAETTSNQAISGLKNEVNALKALKGLGVPEVYETGEASHGSKSYFYMIIEYIKGMRVEKELNDLPAVEHAKILTQFFGLMANAHNMGIVNGDIDLKHLFWRQNGNTKQLVVIDWGNAMLGNDQTDKKEFAYDLARSAEIIFALVTRQGSPSSQGTLILPENSDILPKLLPLPTEFYTLCRWAPRTHSDLAKAPVSAEELYKSSNNWLSSIISKPRRLVFRLAASLVGISLLASFVFGLIKNPNSNVNMTPSRVPSSISIATTNSPIATLTPSPTGTSSLTETSTIVETPTPPITPLPSLYTPIPIATDPANPLAHCWKNEVGPPTASTPIPTLTNQEGIQTRRFDANLQFVIDQYRKPTNPIQTDFGSCFNGQGVAAISFNAQVNRIGIDTQSQEKLASEWGIFLENENGKRREYTLWVDDTSGALYLRVREGENEDYKQSVISPRRKGEYPYPFYEYSVVIYLEIDNHDLDIFYLMPGLGNLPLIFDDTTLSQMIRVDDAVRPTFDNVKKIGLVGRGLNSQIVLLPLTFYKR
jgi:hypothetical protein